MNVLLNVFTQKEFWIFFQKSIVSLTDRQKKIGLIVGVAFSAIAVAYLFCRCWDTNTHIVEVKKGEGGDSTDSLLTHSMTSESGIEEIELELNRISIDEDDGIHDETNRLVSDGDTPYIGEPISDLWRSSKNRCDPSVHCNLTEFFED